MSKMSKREALMANITNSPLVPVRADRIEREITRPPLYFIRNLRAPTPSLDPIGNLFGLAIGKTAQEGFDEKLRAEWLLDYEQYFARIELLNLLWTCEAGFRQLIKAHLCDSKDQAIKVMVEQLDRDGNSYILNGIYPLLRRAIILAEGKTETTLQIAFDRFSSKMCTLLLKPIILIRHGICHGNMRAYIDHRYGGVGARNEKDIDGRAIDIYEQIDALSFHAIHSNVWKLFYEFCYLSLVKKAPDKMLASLLELIAMHKMASAKLGAFPLTWLDSIGAEVRNNFKGTATGDACLETAAAYDVFINEAVA